MCQRFNTQKMYCMILASYNYTIFSLFRNTLIPIPSSSNSRKPLRPELQPKQICVLLKLLKESSGSWVCSAVTNTPSHNPEEKTKSQIAHLHSEKILLAQKLPMIYKQTTDTNILRKRRKYLYPSPFIYGFLDLLTARFLPLLCFLSLDSWNLIYVFPLAFLLSPSTPGMPESSALPSVWSCVSADLQQIVYFARHRGNMDALFTGSRFTAELQPGSSARSVWDKAPL